MSQRYVTPPPPEDRFAEEIEQAGVSGQPNEMPRVSGSSNARSTCEHARNITRAGYERGTILKWACGCAGGDCAASSARDATYRQQQHDDAKKGELRCGSTGHG